MINRTPAEPCLLHPTCSFASLSARRSDPNYFDFISLCQYATISSGMRNGRLLFEEQVDAEGATVVVRRDLSLPQANDGLPDAHAARVGDSILDWIAEQAPNLSPAVLPVGSATAAALLTGVGRIRTVFEINEFMLTSEVAPLAGGDGITWKLVAPATMWSAQVLRLRGDVTNDFEAKAVLAYLRRCGVPASCTTRIEQGGTQITHEFRWPKGFIREA